MKRNIKDGELGGIALIGAGFVLVLLTVSGFFIGAFLGRNLGSEFIGSIVGTIFGVGVGFYDLYRIASRVIRRYDRIKAEEEAEATATKTDATGTKKTEITSDEVISHADKEILENKYINEIEAETKAALEKIERAEKDMESALDALKDKEE